jgi:hypothetical protein
VEWIHLAHGRDRWRAVVNAVMNLRVLALRSYLVICFFNPTTLLLFFEKRKTLLITDLVN